MKRAPDRRPIRAPLDIVEVPSTRPDPRSPEPDLSSRAPAVTQKISRAELDEALQRTKSGTRRAARSEHELPPNDDDPRRERDSLPGPRDDEDNPHVGPQVTIVRIDSMEMDLVDPPPPARTSPTRGSATPMGSMTAAAELHVPPTSPAGTPLFDRKRRPWATERLQITPRVAFVAGLSIAVVVLLAACIGFFAGRLVPGSR